MAVIVTNTINFSLNFINYITFVTGSFDSNTDLYFSS